MNKRTLFTVVMFVAFLVTLSAVPAFAKTQPLAVATCTTTLNPGDDIQAAVNSAQPGDVLCLTAGTYTPAATITLGQSVTLQGPQADVDPRPSAGTTRTPGSAAEAILDGGNTLTTILNITANDVVINGLEVRNALGDMIASPTNSNIANLVLQFNILRNAGDEGAQIRDCADCIIEYNYVPDIAQDGLNLCCGSTDGIIRFNEVSNNGSDNGAIYVYEADNTTVEGNLVYDVLGNDGIKLGAKNGSDAAGNGGTVINNVVHDTAQDSISIYTSNTLVDGNEVYNSGSENGAIYLAYGISNITLTNNHIHDNVLNTGKWGDPGGIMIGTAVNATTVSASNNCLVGNTPNGLTNKASGQVTAENNWWNDAGGPSGAGSGAGDAVSSNVDFDPWQAAPIVGVCAQASPGPHTVTLHVANSQGAPLANVPVYYRVNGNTNWTAIGNTNGSGTATTVLNNGDYDFHAVYNQTTATETAVTINTPTDVTFTTGQSIIQVKNSGGNPLNGVPIYYKTGYQGNTNWTFIGNTSGGQVTLETFSRSIDFHAVYNETSITEEAVSSGATILFQTEKTTVEVKDSNNTPLNGVPVYYRTGYLGHTNWNLIGSTSSGQVSIETFPRSIDFHAVHNETTATQEAQASGSTVTFNTYKTVVNVAACSGDAVSGVEIYFRTGYGGATNWTFYDHTNANGEVAIEFFSRGTGADFHARTPADWMTATETLAPLPASGPNAVTFIMEEVSFQYGGQILWQNPKGQWKTFTSPMNMFPRTYQFKFDGQPQSITVSGDGSCQMAQTVALLKLTDHAGQPLAGATARGGYGSSYSTWHVAGSTDANGILFDYRDGLHSTMSYEMRFNGTTAHLTQDVTVDPVFEFQTDLLTLRMETCDGTPLDGGSARYGGGSTYSTAWFPGGSTGAAAPGETTAEFFPGEYAFQMQYQATADEKLNVNFPADGNTLTWQTTNVALNYSDQISYGGASGDSTWFTKPSMELLPGTYTFHFRGAGRTDLTFGGCSYEHNMVAVKLIDSQGNGLAGGVAKYYSGGWQTIGTTDASGLLMLNLNQPLGNLKFRMEYGGAAQEFYQNVSNNSVVVFQTELVTVNLKDSTDHTGNLAEGTAKYYASGWKTIGETVGGVTNIELLPLNYKFRMEYGGAAQEFYQNVGSNPTVNFQTTLVTVNLKDHTGNSGYLPAEGTAKYYASGWKTIGETVGGVTSIELLPLNYKFRMEYGGAAQEFYKNVSSDPTVEFQTELVTVGLQSTGSPISGGLAKYYASGWKTIGVTDSNGETTVELLPLNYKFRMEYGGAANEKYQNVATNPAVIFTAQNTFPTVIFQDSQGNGIEGAVIKYYASGWKIFGTTDANGIVTKEDLLPGNYKFRIEYEGAAQEQYHDVRTEQPLVFQTVAVTVQLLNHNGAIGNLLAEGTAKYYASGWRTIGATSGGVATVELLPLNYKFRMEYGGGAKEFYQNVGDEPVVEFQTTLVTVNLENHDGELGMLPAEGTAKYYASGWKTIGETAGGVTSIELLPLNYKFRMEYGGAAQEFYQDMAADTEVMFRTSEVTVALQDCDDAGIEGGIAKYYASGWKSIDITDESGLTTIELLPLNYKFRMEYGGAANEFYQNVGSDTAVTFTATKFEYVSTETVKYYASGWKTVTGPIYMLPGTYRFQIGSETQYLDISGCSLIGGAVTIQAVDSQGNPLSGVEVSAFKPNTGGFTMGTTDATGKVTATLPWHGNGIVFTARYAKSSASAAVDVVELLNPNPLHTFQTTVAMMEVRDCEGNAVEGTAVTYFISNSGGGNVGTVGPSGIVSRELFPGTYSFTATINRTSVSSNVNITAGDPIDHTFVPTVVEFHHSLGKVSMWQNNIGGTVFNGPTYIFEGTYTIDFYEGNNTKLYSMPLTVTDGTCSIEQSMLVLDLIDSSGNGLADGAFKYRFGWGDYTEIGTTDANGRLYHSLDGPPTNTKVTVTYNGASIEKQQNVATDSHFVFQTVPVTAVLNDSNGAPLNGATFEYRYGWGSKETFPGLMELLPVNTKITVSYMGASIEREQHAGTDPDFVFATVPITAVLNDSNGAPLSGATFEYRYGWGSKQPFTGPMELLPVNTKITVSYAGASIEKEQNANTTPDFVFATVPVTATLLASDGVTDLSGDATFEYRYGWGTKQAFDGAEELLPVNTKITVTYAGASIEKEQNVGSDPDFVFQTGKV
ncbi:MAG: right-handed parallel beta-helix repeat-containing protein, partial [Candidatus Promineifilaceae bacterium]